MGSNSEYETIQLPRTAYDTELDRFVDIVSFVLSSFFLREKEEGFRLPYALMKYLPFSGFVYFRDLQISVFSFPSTVLGLCLASFMFDKSNFLLK